MKVNAYKNVDIEFEVDVDLDDCINEWLSTAKEDGMQRSKIAAVDGATKVLEKITPDMVGDVLSRNPSAIELIRQRLQKWIEAT